MSVARTLVTVVIAVMLAAPWCAHAQGTDAAARKAMDRCGLNAMLSKIGSQIDESIRRNPTPLPAEAREALSAAMKSAFRADALASHMRKPIAGMTAGELREVTRFCDSPLGRRVTAEELRADSAETEEEVARYAERLQSEPAAPARVRLIERLEKASAAVPVAVAMIEGITLGIATGVSALQSSDTDEELADAERQLASVRDMLTEQIAQTMRLSMLYTYRRLSDADVERYVAQLESPAGRAFSAAIGGGIVSGISAAARRVGEDLRLRMDPARSKT